MKRRVLTTLVALIVVSWGAIGSRAETILVTDFGMGAGTTVTRAVGTAGGAFNNATQSLFATTNISAPLGIAQDASGNVYVVNNNQMTSTNINSVAEFTAAGAPAGTNGFYVPSTATTPPPVLNAPVDIAFTTPGGPNTTQPLSYVTNLETSAVGGTVTPAQPGSVGQFSVTNPGSNANNPANFQGTFAGGVAAMSPNPPNGPNGFAASYGIGVNPVNGLVYVVNSSAAAGIPGNDVTVYNPANAGVSPTGRQVTNTFGNTGGNGTGLLVDPLGIAFDKAGNVYVSSFGNSSTVTGNPLTNGGYEAIYEYSATGLFIREVAFFNPGTGAGDPFLFAPVGLAIDSNNNLFVALSLSNQVEVFNLNTPGSDLTGTIFASGGSLNDPTFLVVQTVPEPSSIVMLGLGLIVPLGFCLVRRGRKALAVA